MLAVQPCCGGFSGALVVELAGSSVVLQLMVATTSSVMELAAVEVSPNFTML